MEKNYNLEEEFEMDIKEIVKEVRNLCMMYKIPFLMSFATSAENGNAKFKNFYASFNQFDYEVENNQFVDFVNVLNGFKTVPPKSMYEKDLAEREEEFFLDSFNQGDSNG